jgi:segregation and condensation protein A
MNSTANYVIYKVTTPVYEGPLDLLLQLIERAELDITKLALAQVTDQYLAYLEAMPDLSPDEVSGFLVIAARLIQIKSEALLPRPPVRHLDEEDPGEALARQLIVYRRYKRVAEYLDKRQQAHWITFLRLAPPTVMKGHVDLAGIGVQDLAEAADFVYNRTPRPQAPLVAAITPPRITIRQKIRAIAKLLALDRQLSFKKLIFGSNSRLEIVVTFLAMLELSRLHLIKVYQATTFADIDIEVEEQWREGDDLELEFGE